MNEVRAFAPRRLLVALDASAASLEALTTAVAWAERFHAELVGLFVRDARWELLAAHPAARHVDAASGARRTPDPDAMSEAITAFARAARRRLESLAAQARVAVEFREERGAVASCLLAAARTADVVIAGRTGWGPAGRARLGSTARALLGSPQAPVLLAGVRPTRAGAVGVALRVAPFEEQSLEAALALARAQGAKVAALLVGGTEGERRAAEREVHARAQRAQVALTTRSVPAGAFEAWAPALDAPSCQTLVVSRRLLMDGLSLAACVASIPCPVLLLP